jgi:hypothetical protein
MNLYPHSVIVRTRRFALRTPVSALCARAVVPAFLRDERFLDGVIH